MPIFTADPQRPAGNASQPSTPKHFQRSSGDQVDVPGTQAQTILVEQSAYLAGTASLDYLLIIAGQMLKLTSLARTQRPDCCGDGLTALRVDRLAIALNPAFRRC